LICRGSLQHFGGIGFVNAFDLSRQPEAFWWLLAELAEFISF